MSPLEIILLSLFGGGFLVTLLGALAYLIYASLQLRKLNAELRSTLSQSQSASQRMKEETVRAIEGERVAIMAAFTSMQTELGGMIKQLNGEKLLEAAKVNVAAAGRMEKSYLAIQELLSLVISDFQMNKEKALGETTPEGYAVSTPGEPSLISQSSVAAGDEEANRETYE